MARPWALTSSHLNTASVQYLLDICIFSFLSPFFLYYFRVLIFSFLCFLIFVVPSLLIRKASRQQLTRIFPSKRLTLSPVTGRRPDYTIFSVNIRVTDVTKNSLLFAVSSATCSTLLKEPVPVFSPPIDMKQAHLTVQHTQSVSVPIRHPRDNERSIVTSFETDMYIYIANTRYQVHTYAVYSYVHACGVCGLFSWSMAAGRSAFSYR